MRTRSSKKVAAAVICASMTVLSIPVAAHAAPDSTAPNADPTSPPFSALPAERVYLRNQKSNLVLAPLGTASAAGTKIVQKVAGGGARQQWIFIDAGDFVSLQNYGVQVPMNMGIDGASTAVGKAAILATPDATANQDWTVLPKDNTWFRFQNRKSGLCLGITGGSTSVNAVAAQFPCDDTLNQTWRFN